MTPVGAGVGNDWLIILYSNCSTRASSGKGRTEPWQLTMQFLQRI